MSEIVLRANQVTKSYQTNGRTVHAVRGISLDICEGRTLAIVGESGCGKSTLARLLVGLERPDSGIVESSDAIVPMVFQDSLGSLHPRRKAAQLIVEPLLIQQKRWRMTPELEDQARTLALSVGLQVELLGRYPHELSGGQRQRVNIARALALSPKVLVLDEPVSALDVSIQAQILNLLLKLQSQKNLALVFISHDLSVVRHLAHDVYVLYLGQVVESGPVLSVLSKPLHPYTQALLASEPKVGVDQFVLPGEPPSPFEEFKGCDFAGRCPMVEPACRLAKPALKIYHRHGVACFPVSRTLEQSDATALS